MKVFIMAIDALEYNLVEKWDLKNLKQTTYGKGMVFFTRDNKAYTPAMWTSFITGKHPSEHGINEWWSWGKFLDFIRLKTPLAKIKGKQKIIRPILEFFNIKPKRPISKRDWKKNIPTIFDVVKPSIPLFIPAYNEPKEFHQFNENMEPEEIARIVAENHEKRKKIMFEKLEKEWKLFMVWFDILDLYGHIFWTLNPKKLEKAYREMDSLVPKIKSKIDGEYIFLIISDHGMELSEDGVTGDHSDHFFWSLNIETDWKPKYITDFYPKIIEWTKSQSSRFSNTFLTSSKSFMESIDFQKPSNL